MVRGADDGSGGARGEQMARGATQFLRLRTATLAGETVVARSPGASGAGGGGDRGGGMASVVADGCQRHERAEGCKMVLY